MSIRSVTFLPLAFPEFISELRNQSKLNILKNLTITDRWYIVENKKKQDENEMQDTSKKEKGS
ncbi:MAG: hypothetical protein NT130_03950 [Candidatus Micrarchaeota archaeon]|nr:hypothetical protein [Candidatus Micrarchaeota archaeon]